MLKNQKNNKLITVCPSNILNKSGKIISNKLFDRYLQIQYNVYAIAYAFFYFHIPFPNH